MKLTEDQVEDLDDITSYLLDEVDDFSENFEECLQPMSSKYKDKFDEALKALNDKLDAEGDTAEELDALARVSRGHVYCATIRLRDMIRDS